MIFQEPMTSLNPVFTVGYQLEEVLKLHMGLSGRHARERAIESHALGEALKTHVLAHEGKAVDAVYWQFPD